jgi:transcriptional regulator with XRE-family HTH domain
LLVAIRKRCVYQKELAARVNRSPAWLSGILIGRFQASPEDVTRLEVALGATPGELGL